MRFEIEYSLLWDFRIGAFPFKNSLLDFCLNASHPLHDKIELKHSGYTTPRDRKKVTMWYENFSLGVECDGEKTQVADFSNCPQATQLTFAIEIGPHSQSEVMILDD